jgi:F-type H+-transporting ATPase subunit epsilon
MAETLTYELVTPLGTHKAEGITELNLPAESGEMGVLPGHDVMILSLGMGPMVAGYADKKEIFFVDRGFIQIDHNHVRILAEICDGKDEIDVERAAQSKERSEKRVKENLEDLDWKRADAAIKRADFRITIKDM